MNTVTNVMDYIKGFDEEVGKALELEMGRQRRNLELIASENIVSPAVMLAMGTVPTNKYAEGYPGKRYYGGCEHVDILENLAIERAKKLFGCDHACVQPHSGANANNAVYQAFLQPGDTVMGLNLAHGGHLTHGSPVNMSGFLYNFVPYNVNDNGVLYYDDIRRIALECKPKMIVAGASAYPREIRFDIFADEESGILSGECPDRFRGPVAVRNAGCIAEIYDFFVGQQFPYCGGNGQSAKTGIEDTDGLISSHASSISTAISSQ